MQSQKSTESIWFFYRNAWLFMILICVQAFLETLLGLINNFIVGQFGDTDTVAGVASSSNIYDLVWYIFFAIIAAGNIFTAQYLGSKDDHKVQETTNIKLFYTLIFSVLFIIILELFSKEILGLILGTTDQHHQKASEIGTRYSQLTAWNYPLLGFGYVMSLTMNTCGNMKVPFFTALSSLCLNTFLVCILSLPYHNSPNLGIVGMAISLIVARAVECLIFLGYLIIKKPIYRPNLNIFKISHDMHKKYIKAFLPLWISNMLFGASIVVQTSLYSYYGDISVVAAAQITGSAIAIFYSTFRGYNALVSLYVGKNLGAGELNLAKENATKILKLSFINSLIISLIIVSCAFWVPKTLFPNLTAEALYLTTWFMAFSAFTYFCINMLQPLFNFLYSGGYTLIVSVFDLFLIWIIDIFVTFILLRWAHIDIKWIMMISCLSKIIDFITSYLLYKIVPWNKKIVGESHEPHGEIITQQP